MTFKNALKKLKNQDLSLRPFLYSGLCVMFCDFAPEDSNNTMTGVEKTGRKRPLTFKSTAFGALPLAVLMVASVSFRVAADHASATVERRAWAMGTRISVTVEAGDRGAAVDASEAALRAVAEVEARLSTWRDRSELSRLNGADPGADFAVSPELESDLREAFHWWEETHGAFDPGIASLVAAWDLRGGGREPSVVELRLARAAAGLGHLALGSGVARHLDSPKPEGPRTTAGHH